MGSQPLGTRPEILKKELLTASGRTQMREFLTKKSPRKKKAENTEGQLLKLKENVFDYFLICINSKKNKKKKTQGFRQNI